MARRSLCHASLRFVSVSSMLSTHPRVFARRSHIQASSTDEQEITEATVLLSRQMYAQMDGEQPTGLDKILVGGEEPPLGAHLTTPRIGFVHHGIYVGDGKVMHCGAASRLLPRGPVEEVSLSSFSRGRPVSVRRAGPARFDAPEVVARARSRVGENSYRLLTNNCEHFAQSCLRGRSRSPGLDSHLY